MVVLDPENAHWMSGSIGKKNREFMLSKVQLEAIAEAAQIQIVESKPLPASSPEIIVWQVRGEVEGPDGKRQIIVKTYELDMRLKDRDGVDGGYILMARGRVAEKVKKIHDFPKDQHKPWMPKLDDAEAWNAYIEEQAMKDWTMTNRHRVARAESGATLRAIRSKCRIRSVYKEEEFKDPWVVYRAEFDVGRALQAGGPVGEMAMKGIAGAMTRSLGLPDTMIAGFLKSINPASGTEYTGPNDVDLLNATEEDIEELEAAMVEIGFKTRAMCDGRVIEIFDLPLSQLTKRHVRLMAEYITIGMAAVEAKVEEMADLTAHLHDIMRIAYAEGSSVGELIEESWMLKVYPLEVEEEESEKKPEEESEEEPAGGVTEDTVGEICRGTEEEEEEEEEPAEDEGE
jgi:hypothetical protein